MLGYFIYTAAVIAYLEPNWLALNKDWVNTLVRDAANPSSQDNMFPFSRMMDWYHGHSFAKGLFESADSKDEESSSEDTFFSYASKMWGQVIGDDAMEARGNLMLAIQARTLINYFLLQSDNVNQPTNFIGNKVTGIVCPPTKTFSFSVYSNSADRIIQLFENKIDHTTYFGANPEYIQGHVHPPFLHQPPPSLTPSQYPHASTLSRHTLYPPCILHPRRMEHLLQHHIPLPRLYHHRRLEGHPVWEPSVY